MTYVAPGSAGTYTVKATSVADSTKSASAQVTVNAPASVGITLTPTSASMQSGTTKQFSATVTGSSNTSVTWSATGGSVSSAGLYTAPGSAGTYTVTATSAADTTKKASATVTVTAAAAVSVSVSPTTASLNAGTTKTFTATVTGSSNTAVTWTATGGTVSSAGLYTAPSSAGTYTVTATSAADTTKKASATVTVTSTAAVAVSISPTSTALAPNANTTFTATVSNSSNTAVTWSASGGTISGTGNSITYTAPSSTGSYTVTATSMADTSKQASATITDASNSAGKFEGYGANATGGSNVVHVTNTSSSGSGSFAAAIASSGNHVVFDVGGTISGTFYIPSNTTIDGFSAPSPGITFTGGSGSAGILNVENVSNIVIQGVRIRNTSSDNTKGIMFYESSNGSNHDIVVDHCEIDNVSDEDLGSMAHNVTISWNLLGAPASSGGELIKYDAYHYSIHHNLWVGFTGNDSRVPLVWAGNDSTSADSWNGNTVADVVGNVQSQFLYGITYVTDGADQDHSNIMNNYLDGQDSSHARNGIDIMASSLEQHYIAGNASVINPAGSPSTYGCGASNICGTYSIVQRRISLAVVKSVLHLRCRASPRRVCTTRRDALRNGTT